MPHGSNRSLETLRIARPRWHQDDKCEPCGSAVSIMREVHADFLRTFPTLTADEIPLVEIGALDCVGDAQRDES